MSDGFFGGRFGDLIDDSYDGSRSKAGFLSAGLGQLADGIRGHENYKVNAGYEWIGWRSANETVDMVFQFEQVANFSSVSVHVHNLFRKSVEVFSSARVSFSFDGLAWSESPLELEFLADHQIEAPRDVLIHLHQRTGRFVKLSLAFAAKWLLVSEVSFEATPVAANYVPDPKDLESPLAGRARTRAWSGSAKSTLHSALVLVGIGLLALTLSIALTVFVYRFCFGRSRKNFKQPHCLYSADVDLMGSGLRTALNAGGSDGSSGGPVYCEPEYHAGGLFGSAGRVTKIYKDHSTVDHEYAVPDVVYKDTLAALTTGRAGHHLIQNPLGGDEFVKTRRPIASSVPATTLYIDSKNGSVVRSPGKPVYQI